MSGAYLPAPLERMYPNRCYDCQAPIPMADVLCDECKTVYGAARVWRP